MAKKAPLRDTLARLVDDLVDAVLTAAARDERYRPARAPARVVPPRRAKAPRPEKRPVGRGGNDGAGVASVTNPELLLAAIAGSPSPESAVSAAASPVAAPVRRRASASRRPRTVLVEAAPPAQAPAPIALPLRGDEVSMVSARGAMVIRRARRGDA